MKKKPLTPDNLLVLYEDNHLLVVNKPAGTLVQGDKTGDEPLVEVGKKYIKDKYNKPGKVFLGVVHRLDRPVSGVLLFARTSKALERMNKQFRNRDTNKIYWAIVKKRPPKQNDTLTHWLLKDNTKNTVKAFDHPVEGAQKATTHYRNLGKLNDHFLLEVRPVTGRPHQIRVQLASMGCPIRGDLKYGFSKANPDGNINLHARQLMIGHPTQKEEIKFTAPLPDDLFWEQFLTLDPVKIKDKDIDKLW
jgi:23S rRNA pseudouridine1911/1915/1917 synthase